MNAIPAARRADEAGRAASEALARAEGQVRQLEAIVGSVEGALDFARAQLGGGIGFEIELRPGGTFSARESEVGTVTHELTGDWVIDGENVTITTRQRDGQPPKPGEVAVKNGIFRDGRITMAMPGGVAVPMVRK